MTTYAELVQDVHSMLHSYTGLHEQVTWLTTGVDSLALDFLVADGSSIQVGVNEVEDELVYVSAVTDGQLAIAPFGRGYHGSTAAAHDANVKVTKDPLFPRKDIKRAIQQTLDQVYPDLYKISSTTFTFNGPQLTYELPADVDQVLEVSWDVTGPSNMWAPVYGWWLEEDSEEATGKSITLIEMPEQGRTIKVLYAGQFGALSADATTLTSIGFPESAADVLTFGAKHRLLRSLDVARLQGRTVENLSRASTTRADDATRLANQDLAYFTQRLAEERLKLLKLHSPRIHYTG